MEEQLIHGGYRPEASLLATGSGDLIPAGISGSNPSFGPMVVGAVGDLGSVLVPNVPDLQVRSIHGFSDGGSYLSLLACLGSVSPFQHAGPFMYGDGITYSTKAPSSRTVDEELQAQSIYSPSSTSGSQSEFGIPIEDESNRHYEGDESDTCDEDLTQQHIAHHIEVGYSSCEQEPSGRSRRRHLATMETMRHHLRMVASSLFLPLLQLGTIWRVLSALMPLVVMLSLISCPTFRRVTGTVTKLELSPQELAEEDAWSCSRFDQDYDFVPENLCRRHFYPFRQATKRSRVMH
uniref:Uncharacterized protein n=1 Tax=Arundo donax TaxID=35708 RepID=A0A0A8Y4E9_ARUDO